MLSVQGYRRDNLPQDCYSALSRSGRYLCAISPSCPNRLWLDKDDEIILKIFNFDIEKIWNIKTVIQLDNTERYDCCNDDLLLIQSKNKSIIIYNLDTFEVLLDTKIMNELIIIDSVGSRTNKKNWIIAIASISSIHIFSCLPSIAFFNFTKISNKSKLTDNIISAFKSNKNLHSSIQNENIIQYYHVINTNFESNINNLGISSTGKIYIGTNDELYYFQIPSLHYKYRRYFEIIHLFTMESKISNHINILRILPFNTYQSTLPCNSVFESIFFLYTSNQDLNKSLNLGLLTSNNLVNSIDWDTNFIFNNITEIYNSPCSNFELSNKILSCEVFKSGYLGIIWIFDNEIFLHIFNSSLSPDNIRELTFSPFIEKKNSETKFRNLYSLLYGDVPLNKCGLDSMIDENSEVILRIHNTIFSDSLNKRDIETEEQLLYRISINQKNMGVILQNMDFIKFIDTPQQYSPIICTTNANNKDIFTPDNWFSNLSFNIKVSLSKPLVLLNISYICWYHGIEQYLKFNLLSIIQNPQTHISILQHLSLLPINMNFSSPTALQNLFSINISLQKKNKNDLSLCYSILDLYVQSGLYDPIITYLSSETLSEGALDIMYNWIDLRMEKILLTIFKYCNNIPNNDFENKLFELSQFQDTEKNLNLIFHICFKLTKSDGHILSLIIGCNYNILKSLLYIMKFIIFNKNEVPEIISFYALIQSLFCWNGFFKILTCKDSNSTSICDIIKMDLFKAENSEFLNKLIEELAINSRINSETLYSHIQLKEPQPEWSSLLSASILFYYYNYYSKQLFTNITEEIPLAPILDYLINTYPKARLLLPLAYHII
ncbi:uncharacterized protein CMU_026640 [Cryptosporidium muris RN66]|uniref:Uncharacterized protein n=1 Tax=Cryptosporidium muris (strain RN66) TaxID=441375 RepID=B6ABA4_CRYMR|nr:uncharacterized protein CMU_026640 [Cryptosporidium muris RN66]EEA05656.1 hypothetical protein CMU_026640 [Cryptosporidium muris RN66]|eukprot:XP_002140005.1 hypothetical protein [Cryptosporidium muris RN66]